MEPRICLIVESENDKATFQAIINSLFSGRIQELEVIQAEPKPEPYAGSVEWKFQSAEKYDIPVGLAKSLLSLFTEINKEKYDKVAVIWDADDLGIPKRVEQIGNALENAKVDYQASNPNIPVVFARLSSPNLPITLKVGHGECEFLCHIVNLKGNGEIEDILKELKDQPSPIADCVDDKMRECLRMNDEEQLREKDMVKLWINHYQRYDTLMKKERNWKNTTWQAMMNRGIFNLKADSPVEYKELKDFLSSLLL